MAGAARRRSCLYGGVCSRGQPHAARGDLPRRTRGRYRRQAGDVDYAVAGGNVCAVAQARGIAAFVVDGVIRDLAEIRALGFPVFARGVIPIPGKKEKLGVLGGAVRCGGVNVEAGDIVVGDEEGIVVVPALQADTVLEKAKARAAAEETDLKKWEADHRARIEGILRNRGFSGEADA